MHERGCEHSFRHVQCRPPVGYPCRNYDITGKMFQSEARRVVVLRRGCEMSY